MINKFLQVKFHPVKYRRNNVGTWIMIPVELSTNSNKTMPKNSQQIGNLVLDEVTCLILIGGLLFTMVLAESS